MMYRIVLSLTLLVCCVGCPPPSKSAPQLIQSTQSRFKVSEEGSAGRFIIYVVTDTKTEQDYMVLVGNSTSYPNSIIPLSQNDGPDQRTDCSSENGVLQAHLSK